MTRQFTTGIETGDLLDFDSVAAQATAVTSPHTGNYSMRIYNGGIAMYKYLTGTHDEVFIRAWMKVDSWVTGRNFIGVELADSTWVRLQIDGSNKFRISRFGTIIATGTLSFTPYQNKWVMLELHLLIADGTGVAQLKVDGNLDIDFSGDTKPSTSTTVERAEFWGYGASTTTYWDDIAINDTDGSADNTWPGDGRVIAIKPDAAGDNIDFTPSAGANYQNVDDVPPDGDTTYNESGSDDDYDLLNLEACGLSGVTILGIDVKLTVRKTVANGDHMRAKIKTSGTEYNGSDQDLATSYTRLVESWRENPYTSSAWVAAELDALQAGYENRAA